MRLPITNCAFCGEVKDLNSFPELLIINLEFDAFKKNAILQKDGNNTACLISSQIIFFNLKSNLHSLVKFGD